MKSLFKVVIFCCLLLLIIPTPNSFINAQTTFSPRMYFETLDMQVQLQLLGTQLTDNVEIVMSQSNDAKKRYFSIGSAEIAMTGRFVGCSYPSASATPASVCYDMTGDGYDADLAGTQVSTLVSANVSSSGLAMVVVRTPLSNLGITSKGKHRFIYARGEIDSEDDGSSAELGEHGSDFSFAEIDIFAGTVSVGLTNTWNTYVAMACAWLVTILLAVVGATLKNTHERSGRTVSFFLHVIVCLVILGCFLAVLFVALREFKKTHKFNPLGRAIGAALCYMFSIIILPTTKYINISYICGGSFDRIISTYHVWGGIIVFIVVLIHFFLFVANTAKLGFVGMLFSWEEGVQPVLPAFIGFIIMIFFTVAALLRQYCSYYFFRISHFMFLPVLVLFMIHYPPLAVACSPALLMYFIDFALKFKTSAKIIGSSYDKESSVCKLVVDVSENPSEAEKYAKGHSGQFCFFSIPNLGFPLGFLPHPFTFAHRTTDGKLTFFIKNSGTFTKLLCEKVEAKETADLLLQTFSGPFGSTEVDLDFPSDIVLVAGGIGITAPLGLLYTMAERCTAIPFSSSSSSLKDNKNSNNNNETPAIIDTAIDGDNAAAASASASSKSRGQLSSTRSINFIWCVREVSLVNMILPHIEACSRKIQTESAHPITIQTKIFLTGKDIPKTNAFFTDDATIQYETRRPAVDDMLPLETRSGGSVAYFMCGPEPLCESAKQAAKKANTNLIHEEVFSF